MTTPVRVNADDAYNTVTSGSALLVCAYDSDEKYETYKLAGSIPFSKLKGMLNDIPKVQEIIFYCA